LDGWEDLRKMAWRALLDGDITDLEELSQSINSDELSITKFDNKYYLSSKALSDAKDCEELWPVLYNYAIYISAIANLLLDSRRNITINSLENIDLEGKRHIFMPTLSFEVNARVGFATLSVRNQDGTIHEEHISGSSKELFDIGIREEAVAKVYRLIALKGLDWVNLFRVYEILRHDIGGEGNIVTKGWATTTQLSAFRSGANRPDVSGDDARHGVLPGPPPKNTMDLSKARIFIKGLVRNWLDEKRP
jgi:hypothetical protein